MPSSAETAWVSADPDTGSSGSGPALNASYGVTDFVHLVGLYNDVDFDPVEMTTWGVGAGVHHSLRDGVDLCKHAPQRRTFADDAPIVHRHADLFAQVIALAFELFTQAGVFGQGRPQLALGTFSFRYVL